MKILVGLLITPWVTMLRGFVLVKLWHWFVVPLGAIELSIPIALGISLIVGFLTNNISSPVEKRDWWETMVIGTLVSLITLGFGWIYHLFV